MDLRENFLCILSDYGFAQANTDEFLRVKTAFESLDEEIQRIALSKEYRNAEVASSFRNGSQLLNIPWFVIFDNKEDRVQYREVYVMLLFKADMSGVYLTVNLGSGMIYSAPIATLDFFEDVEIGSIELSKKFLHLLDSGFSFDKNIDLADSGIVAKAHEKATVVYKYYDRNKLPSEEEIESDISKVLDAYENSIRSVCSGDVKSVIEEEFINEQERRAKHARTLLYEELLKRATETTTSVYQRVISYRIVRNANVAEVAKRRAKGKCQLCEQDAPFRDRDGKPFLEVHHIVWLSKEGKDVVENVVALCPNCHSKMHVLDLKEDKALLSNRINEIKKQVLR